MSWLLKKKFWIILFVVFLFLIPLLTYLFKIKITPKKSDSTQPGQCLIVEEQYCSQTEVIDWTNPAGQQLKIIGLRLDSAVDIPLFMPIDGQITKVKLPDDGVFKGFQSMIFDPEDRNTLRYIFVGDLKFPNMLSLNFKKGDPVGYIQNTGIENAGGYNFLFYVIRGAGKDATSAEDFLNEMFPY